MVKEASVIARERRVQRELSLRSVAAEAAAVGLLAEAISERSGEEGSREREQEGGGGAIGLCHGQEGQALDAIIEKLESRGAFDEQRRLTKEDAELAIEEVFSGNGRAGEGDRREDDSASANEGHENADLRLSVVSAFDIPFVPMDEVKYKRLGGTDVADGPKRSVLGDSGSKAEVYRERLHLILQRTLRHPNFVKPTFDYERRYVSRQLYISVLASA